MASQVGRTVRVARALLEVLAPLTGSRSYATATVRSTGASDVKLPCGSFAAPIVVSAAGAKQVRRELLFRTRADVVLNATGVPVSVVSLLGGLRHNLASATELRWDPPLPGVELVSTLAGAATLGAESALSYGVKFATIFEGVGGATAARDLFAALSQSQTPALVLAWQGTQRGDQVGRDAYARTDTWNLYAVTDRGDGSVERAQVGLDLMDAAEELLQGRASVAGYVFSAPDHCEVTARSRVGISPSSHVYSLTLTTQNVVVRRDDRGETSPEGEAVIKDFDSFELWSGSGDPMFPVVRGLKERILQGAFDDSFDGGFK